MIETARWSDDIASARVVYTRAQIAGRVAELGRSITAAYPDGELVVLALLKGSFVFVADLVRHVTRPITVDFVVAESYGSGTTSSGNVRLVYDPAVELEDRHVLLVEDIIDSGRTIDRIVPMLQARGPRSLELCTLLHKRLVDSPVLRARWVGFDAPPAFLVGYGLDHAGRHRNLPFIASL